MALPITTLYVSYFALFFIYLAWRVVSLRKKHHVGIGTSDHKDLEVAARCHGNAVEYVPVTLLLLLVSELNHFPVWILHAAGATLVVSRILHVIGMTSTQGGTSFGRFYGILGSWLVLIALALINLSLFLGVHYS